MCQQIAVSNEGVKLLIFAVLKSKQQKGEVQNKQQTEKSAKTGIQGQEVHIFTYIYISADEHNPDADLLYILLH